MTEIHEILREIGRRRRREGENAARLALDTEAALKRARVEKVSMTEAAKLVGLDRTSVYRTYGA